ncbi:MAG: DUF167 domain-containing protein [Nitrososphaerota archaeon]
MAGNRRAAGGASSRPPGVREEGARLIVSVRVTPRARRNALALENGVIRAWLTAPPVEGAANAALLALLAEQLGVPKRAVTLVRGETAREKVVAIEGISADILRQRIAASS